MFHNRRGLAYLQKTEDNLPADIVLVDGEEDGFEELEGASCDVIFGV